MVWISHQSLERESLNSSLEPIKGVGDAEYVTVRVCEWASVSVWDV